MSNDQKKYFHLLKEQVALQLHTNYSEVNRDISEWKGQDIVWFQEDLQEKVGGRISEKWFYTHIKSEQDKLPRVDMLDMLSTYIGFRSWKDFVSQHETSISKDDEPVSSTSTMKASRIPVIIFGIVGLGLGTYFTFFQESLKTYQFCFLDETLHKPVKGNTIRIQVLRENQSPQRFKCDSNACFSYATKADKLSIVIESPYYKADTITRFFDKKIQEEVYLKTDDYALMIHYFTHSNVKSWKARRKHLMEIIDDDAKIYQVYGGELIGIEYYSKMDFINKLSLPVKGLKNLQVLDTKYNGGKIIELKFTQKDS